MVTMPATAAPFEGELIQTCGGLVSDVAIENESGKSVGFELPALSPHRTWYV
jgi:hypothetical protein